MTSDPNLETLVERWVDRYLESGEDSAEELCPVDPQQAAALRRRIDGLRAAGLLDELAPRPDTPTQLGEFVLVEPIGQGGMGAVWRAEQPSLGRDVAIKLMRPEQLLMAGSRERFRREIESVARLRAPGVIPIHAVGEDRGVPYYAMELIQGHDLSRQIAALAGRDPTRLIGEDARRALDGDDETSSSDADGLFGGSYFQFASRVALQLARTLAHVHAHGILHRDVKPSNVMLDASGRVTLLDFGLARTTEPSELTRSQVPIGSLPYMAPEQVLGNHAAVDPRTDVYGIGITLYELLTLQPAFSGDAGAIRAAVLAGDIRRPATIASGLPRDLENVCLKACDADPGRRYRTAGELADDLLRFLEHRPVEARRAGPILRLRRWGQRRPASATAAALLGAFAVLGPSVYAWQQNQATARIGEALEEARRHESIYLDALLASLAAVDGSAHRFLEHDAVTGSGSLDGTREEALRALTTFYDRLHENDREHPAIRRELAQALGRFGSVHQTLGHWDQAVATLRRAIALQEQEVRTAEASGEDSPPLHARLASLRLELAHALDGAGEAAEARSQTRQAAATLDAMTATTNDPRWAFLRVRAATAEANGEFRAGEIDAPLASYETWLPVMRRLHEESPDDPDFRGHLAQMQTNYASGLIRANRLREAVAGYGEAIATLDATEDKTASRSWGPLASALYHRGHLRQLAGDHTNALPDLQRSTELLRELVARFPARTRWRDRLADSLAAVGSSLKSTGDHVGAAAALREAIDIREHLGSQTDEASAADLAKLRSSLGDTLSRIGEHDTAIQHHEHAVTTLASLITDGTPLVADRLREIAIARLFLSRAHWRNDDATAAIDEGRRAVDAWHDARVAAPKDAQVATYQIQAIHVLATMLGHRSLTTELETLLRRAAEEWQIPVSEFERYRETVGEAAWQKLTR